MKILITGICGFIGYHVAKELSKDHDIVGIDAMTNYYDVAIKQNRYLNLLPILPLKIETEYINEYMLENSFSDIDFIIHLAAQAGVPFSQENPEETVNNNVYPTTAIFHHADRLGIPVIYASSSSVYECKSIYALTKKWNEEIAAHYKNVPSMGLRLFSIYGPEGRPDQVFYRWIDLLSKGEEIQINGSKDQVVRRNFTHVYDVVEFIKKSIAYLTDNNGIYGTYISDVKNSHNISLTKCVGLLERYMNVKANIKTGELKDYDPMNVIGRDEGIDGISIEEGLKKLTEHLGVYNEK